MNILPSYGCTTLVYLHYLNFTCVVWPEALEDSKDDWEVIDGDLNISELDKVEDKFCMTGTVGDGGMLCVGVDRGEDEVVEETLWQPMQLVGNLSANFCCGNNRCSQK